VADVESLPPALVRRRCSQSAGDDTCFSLGPWTAAGVTDGGGDGLNNVAPHTTAAATATMSNSLCDEEEKLTAIFVSTLGGTIAAAYNASDDDDDDNENDEETNEIVKIDANMLTDISGEVKNTSGKIRKIYIFKNLINKQKLGALKYTVEMLIENFNYIFAVLFLRNWLCKCFNLSAQFLTEEELNPEWSGICSRLEPLSHTVIESIEDNAGVMVSDSEPGEDN
jgi:hypothetical protein